MAMKTGHGHQGRCREVVAWTMDKIYKQLVEYCCSSLSSSLVNIQLVFPLDIPTERFTTCATIGCQSSGCHNSRTRQGTTIVFYQLFIYLVHSPYYNFFMPTLMSMLSRLRKVDLVSFYFSSSFSFSFLFIFLFLFLELRIRIKPVNTRKKA